MENKYGIVGIAHVEMCIRDRNKVSGIASNM